MPVSPDFQEFAQELFAALGPIRANRMFGGVGLYQEDAMFALLVDDVIYLKSDAALAGEFDAAGSSCFSYDTKTGIKKLTTYYALPDSALDDPNEALEWAQKSLIPAQAAAKRRNNKKAKRA